MALLVLVGCESHPRQATWAEGYGPDDNQDNKENEEGETEDSVEYHPEPNPSNDQPAENAPIENPPAETPPAALPPPPPPPPPPTDDDEETEPDDAPPLPPPPPPPADDDADEELPCGTQPPEDETLVLAPESYRIRPAFIEELSYSDPDRVLSPLAAYTFRLRDEAPPPGGNEYVVRIFSKRPEETLEDWMLRSAWTLNYTASVQTVETSNGWIGHVYDTDAMAALPHIHVLIPAECYVYRIDWEDSRLQPLTINEMALREIRDRRMMYFQIPDRFLNFVREMVVR